MENVVSLRKNSVMFKSVLCKEIGIVGHDEVNAVTQLTLKEVDGEECMFVEYVMPVEGEEAGVPMERKIQPTDNDVSPVLFFKNLRTLYKAMSAVDESDDWRETFIIRLMNVLAYQELTLAASADREAIEAEMARLDAETERDGLLGEDDEEATPSMELVVFDTCMIPRYNNNGFIANEELLVITPVEFGSEDKPHYIRSFPAVMFGSCIAVNQHIGVEILSRPRLNSDEDYENMRTGRVVWATNGHATITQHPSYDAINLKEVHGFGTGADGKKYELSLAGASPVNIM